MNAKTDKEAIVAVHNRSGLVYFKILGKWMRPFSDRAYRGKLENLLTVKKDTDEVES